MTRRNTLPILTGLLVCLTLLAAARPSPAEEMNMSTNTPAAVGDAGAQAAEAAVISNQSTLRSTLEIQEEIHNLQVEDEKARRQAAVEAAQTREALNQQLEGIESALASQHVEGLNEIQHSNEMMLIAAGAFACFGFLVLMLSALLQWQMVNRVKALAASLPGSNGMHAGEMQAAIGAAEAPFLGGGVARPTAEFLGAIERLEKRIHDMESTVHTQHALGEGDSATANGQLAFAGMHDNGSTSLPAGAADKARTISLLLGRGQSQLKLDQAEAALASFDEALAIDPAHTDALLKRGAALERMQRFNEAIECYDRAIAADGSMTMAYLHKGGVFNRMERYNEALECYEQALKSQDKGPAAEVMAG